MSDYDELFHDLESGGMITIKGHRSKELLNVQLTPTFELYHTKARSLINGSKQHNYLRHELVWYLSGDRNIRYISQQSKFWNNLADDDNCANSNYGYLTLYEKCHYVDGQIFTPAQWCKYILTHDINTRQAIMMYNKPMYVTLTPDFICTQTQQFLYRDGKLNSTVYIRSSDAIRGLSFDIPWWRFITNVIANSIDKLPGDLTINIGSSHIYEEHFPVVEQMNKERWERYTLHTDLTLDKIYAQKRWHEHDIDKHVWYRGKYD